MSAPPESAGTLSRAEKQERLRAMLSARISRTRTAPASFAQERMWLLDRVEGAGAAYVMQAAVPIRGALDAEALGRAVNELVRRHEALRTTIGDEDGAPVQVIAPFIPRKLRVEEAADVAEVRRIATDDATRPFDLAAGPLFRPRLLRLADDEHVLLMTLHHVVADGWSLGVMRDEVGALYAAFREGLPSPLPEPTFQYADYATQQRERLRGPVVEKHLAYWRERLADAPALLELPTDHPRPAERTVRGASLRVSVGREVAAPLEALARREGASLHMALLAAFQVLLGRYAGTDDVVVGSPVAGRGREELERLIGFFVNTVAVRTDLSGDPDFREVLRRTRAAALGAYAHGEIPFERVVAELRPGRSRGHTPVVQVMFSLENAAPGGSAAEAEPVLLGVHSETSKFDLTLGLESRGDGGFKGSLEYSTDLFHEATVRRMLARWERLLVQVGQQPDAPLSRLAWMDEDERRRVVAEWNRTAAPYPADADLPALFEAHAAGTPDAPALVFGDERLTYAELNARANRLANHLLRAGAGPESRIGIHLERGAEWVVALLATVKAGGAYVPLEPGYPAARLAFMAADAGVSIVVTEDRLRAAFPLPEGVRVVSVDGGAADVAAESAENPGRGTGPRGLAHVIYTSGSTGTPKGVGIEHRGIVRLVVESDLALGPADRVAQASTAAFDAATWEVWGALLNGAALVGISREAALAPERMEALLRAEGVTVLLLPTALFNQVARERPAAFAGMRAVLFGGEAADADALRAVLRAGPPARLENVYGPTENTTISTRHTVRDVAADAVTVPIGRPVANSTAYVLDATLRPLPADLPGELCVGGDGVARGYLGRPALTAERFVPDPFAADPGARMYRTGDRARWMECGSAEVRECGTECVSAEVRECGSGSDSHDVSRTEHEATHALTHSRTHALQFLGRVDGQVKVRGFRIETGEIESAARSFPGVAECVVVAAGEGGERRLVAYVVGGADADGLRAHLRRTLPDYMVPGAFVPLERLPLTPNGKLDRRALPAPGRAARGHVPPRTPTEAAIAMIWAEVLGVESVGATADFFALGGHSLLATRVLSRIRTVLGVEPTVRALFDGSTLAELAQTVDDLRRGDDPQRAAIVPVPRTGDLPMSLAQERLWLADRMRPDSAAYNVSSGLRLRGALDPAALERAVAEVVRRHEALRTTFALRGDTRVQVIHPFTGFGLPVEDLTGLAEAERDEAVRAAAADAGTQPFDLERGPLVRARLLRLADDDHVLMVVMHHVVTDGWSMGLLFGEVAALYAAFREGRPSPLPELPIQYPDYAVWQRAHVQGEAMARHRAYWLQRMAGAPNLLELPTDHPRAARRADAGAGVPLELPAALTARLEALARAEGATLYMVLLAAWQLLLGRYAGADDVVVGSPVAGRTRTETEKLIGFFVNTVVLRTELGGDPSFRALLGRVRTGTLEAQEHQDLPFEALVAELKPERSPGHSPVFQVMFALQTADTASGALPGLRLEAVPVDNRTAMFDLSLLLAPRRGGVAGALRYASDLWERATMVRMAGHFVRILEQVAGDADRPISRLDLLDGEERVRLLNQWSGREAWSPADSTLHASFEAQAARTPDAVALEHEGERTTYAQLDARADRLAHRLAASGVRRGDAVGVCLEWRPELVVALLATLKAGGVYVPMDPSLPAGRLAYMADDAGVRAVVTRAGLADVPSGPARIDVEAEDASAAPAGAPRVRVLPGELAYVIYTSGSTGLPKGVAVEHGAAAAHLSALAGVHGMVAEDRVLQFASAGFDVSLEQVFLPLLTGATLVLRGAVLWSPAEFRERVRDLGITVASLPPAYWREVASGAEPDALRGLRLLLVGGDALPADAADARGAGRLVNCYGPTEAVITATSFPVQPGAAAGAVVPIGRPLPGRAVYVLDPRGALVPAGVAGELYVGGPLLARGYVGRAAQTAERFVPDPFGTTPGGRLYRTGDRVRWMECVSADVRECGSGPDGHDVSRTGHKATHALTDSRTHALEFLGRTDFQVKIRGFRIEPGEIEAALRLHPAVADALVVARADDGGDPRLVAYVAGAAPDASDAGPDAGPDAVPDDALRAQLRRTLPEYMVPSVFVRLERLPLTPSGKVDRRALPAPSADAASTGERPRGGRTPVEEVLGAIWADVLRVEQVAPEDNFFHLGGHSILATTIVARVQETLGVRLSLTSIFQAPTLAELAALVESERRAGAPSLPPVVPVPRDRDLPLSWAQERLFFLDRLQPGLAFYNVPFAVALTGALDVAALQAALAQTVRRHEVLRTVFREADGGAPHLHVSPFDGFHLPVDDLSAAADVQAEARRHAADEARRPFDLHAGPLFRARLLRLADDEHVLLVSMHHAISDEWSTGVLARELSAGYAAAREGRPSPLPELPVQYADYTVWQREQLRGAAMEAQLAYWRARLAGAPALTELPADRPRPALQTHRGASEPFRFPAELLRGLEALGRAEGATLYMVMLGALQVLLARYGGTEDVVVGSPITGRMRHETEGLIGFFANTLVLRTDLSGDPPFREVLRRARQTALGAYDHQDVPFERLVEELQPERSLGHSPLFQVMLLQGAGDPRELELPGLELRRFGGGLGTSKFDLTLAFVPGADGLGVSMEYATDLFDRATVQRMLGHLGRVLEQVIRDPDVRLAELDLLGADERRLVLDAWNATDAPLPADTCAHHLIQAQAARTPDAVAVVHGAVSLTYRELNEAANGLAHRLVALGVGPETRVGICLERGPAMVAAVLAVLKAGGAYVPLDPSYPAPRLAFMAADCGMRVLLTQASLRDALPALDGVRVLDVEELEDGRADDPDSGVGPANLAFVLYTSGSTGTPKGVAMAHDALVNLVGWNRGDAGKPPTTLQFSPISFDVSFQEIAATLSSGGTLVLVDEALRRDPDALLRYMAEHRVERLFLPFVALQALADAAAARVVEASPG